MNTRVAVITGASAGIGAALAKHLGTQGWKVVLAARREKELREVAVSIGDNALAVVMDVTRRADMERLKAAALEKFGQIDVWVNNAGRGVGKKALDLTDAEFDEMMLINTKSVLYGMQAVIPYFQQRGSGHVINISSFLSRVPFATYRSAYSAAKAAMNILSAQVRMDLKADYPNIHVSTVMPGVVLTEFPKNALGGTPPLRMSGVMNPQTAGEVAVAIADVIEHPKGEVYTNPATPEVGRRYYEDVDAFEENMAARQRAEKAKG